ncbi:MAG: sugar nucleotide-binding protein, partial [Candidatus Dormibacteraceae bacterium]
EYVTPTSTADLARQIVRLRRCDAFGLYHATAEGSCSWYGFASEIFALCGLRPCLKAVSPSDFPSKVRRPGYSVLENAGLKSIEMNVFRPWQDGLKEYLAEPARQAA